MILSIVSGTFNRLPALQDMVRSARRNIPIGFTYEIILVDGGSEDGTQDWVREQHDCKLIEQGKLLGAIAAFDAGAELASGKYVLLANDDITFHDNSILPAIMHLENHMDCGAVAFSDNRPLPNYPHTNHKVQVVPTIEGKLIPYAQVGLFRRWLGDFCGWWGANDPDFAGYTYGGDNRLSAKIWEYGYTVEKVENARVDDTVAPDNLRAYNIEQERERGESAYHKMWPKGIEPGKYEKPEQRDKRQARILYLPIYEQRPDTDPARIAQKAQKRGLRDALAEKYLVFELDYLAIPTDVLENVLLTIHDRFRPDMLITQLQGHKPLTEQMISHIRALHPRPVWVNWNGDYWPHALTSPDMLRLLRWFDVQTTVNNSVLPDYERAGIRAAYWQIGFEHSGDMPSAHTGNESYDIVFLANNYSVQRGELGKALHHLASKHGWKLGLYGENWGDMGSGVTTLYDFAAGEAIYADAKIAISDNQFPDASGYVSNRLFQALATGVTVFQQHVEDLDRLTGFQAGTHYVSWSDVDDLEMKLVEYLSAPRQKARLKIGKVGMAYTWQHHSFAARLEELANNILPMARKQPVDVVYLRYTGRSPRGAGGVVGMHGRHYTHNGGLLMVDPVDADFICARFPFERDHNGQSRLEV